MSRLFFVCCQFIMPMHEVIPRVVAIAVRIVMAKWMIFCQSSFFIVMSFLSYNCYVGTLRPYLFINQSSPRRLLPRLSCREG